MSPVEEKPYQDRQESDEKKQVGRCPHAKPKRCIRYYNCLVLLQQVNIARSFNKKTIKELNGFWKETEDWLIPVCEKPSISVSLGITTSIDNFCPEVANHIWGIRATSFDGDAITRNQELDGGVYFKDRILKSKSSIREANKIPYTDCPLYSLLEKRHPRIPSTPEGNIEKAQPPPFEPIDEQKVPESIEESIPSKQIFDHAEDFSWVVFRGQKITLREYQAEAMRLLYKAHQKGAPGLNQHFILTELEDFGSKSDRLRDVFKSREKEVWGEGKLIVPVEGRKGFYRLNRIIPLISR